MLKAIDLNAGLGLRAVALIKAGFTVEKVYDIDAENCEYLSRLLGKSKVVHTDLEHLYPDTIGRHVL